MSTFAQERALRPEHPSDPTLIGLTRKEIAGYDLGALICAAATGDQRSLGFYRSCSQAVAGNTGQQPVTSSSFLLPGDIGRRDLTVASASAGGYLAGQQDVHFASGLYAGLLGALPMRRIVTAANAAVTSMASAATQWLSTEATQASNADPTFTQAAATPKTVSSVSFVSRQLTLQAPGTTGFVGEQLGQKLGDVIGVALINGSGASGEPLGLLGLGGTTSTSGTSLAWSGIRDLLAAAEGYTVGGLVFVLGVTTAKLLRGREKASGNGLVFADGKIDGIPVVVSRCCPADALILAPWPTVSYVSFGAAELTVTPLADPTAFKQGRIGIRIVQSLDFTADKAAVIGKSTSIT